MMSDELLVAAAIAIWMLCTGGLAWTADRIFAGRAQWLRVAGALGLPILVNALFLGTFMFSKKPVLSSPTKTRTELNETVPLRPTISPADPAVALRHQVSEIGPGLVIFNPATEMRVGHHELVTVRIMRGLVDKFAKQPLQGRGALQAEEVKVGNFMRARLFGEGFTVTSHSDESQAVADNDFAEWLYDVLPRNSGDRTLTLQIAIRYKLFDSEEITNLPVLTRDISVQVNPWWTTTTLVADNWQWFFGGIGGLVISVGGFFGKRWFEKRGSGNKAGYADS
jgi:hypothetical protein